MPDGPGIFVSVQCCKSLQALGIEQGLPIIGAVKLRNSIIQRDPIQFAGGENMCLGRKALRIIKTGCFQKQALILAVIDAEYLVAAMRAPPDFLALAAAGRTVPWFQLALFQMKMVSLNEGMKNKGRGRAALAQAAMTGMGENRGAANPIAHLAT